MGHSKPSLKEEAKQLWQAAIRGWDVEQGDMEVDFQEFHTFLLPFYKSRNARDDRMKAMRMYGYIDFPDGIPGAGRKKTVRVFSIPGGSANSGQQRQVLVLSELGRAAPV